MMLLSYETAETAIDGRRARTYAEGGRDVALAPR